MVCLFRAALVELVLALRPVVAPSLVFDALEASPDSVAILPRGRALLPAAATGYGAVRTNGDDVQEDRGSLLAAAPSSRKLQHFLFSVIEVISTVLIKIKIYVYLHVIQKFPI